MNGENKMETVEVKHENLQELYKVLTNYPAISKEQVIHELHKCFGKEAFKLKDVTERIKTFEDACKELGENNPLIHAWKSWDLFGLRNQPDVDAYLKLRIIAAALNEGWKPQFTTDELRYFPCFVLYLPIDEMGNEPKYRVVGRHSMRMRMAELRMQVRVSVFLIRLRTLVLGFSLKQENFRNTQACNSLTFGLITYSIHREFK